MHVATASPTCTRHKIVHWPELLQRRDEAKIRGETVVWTNGCFDLLHMGHVCGLQGARALGDMLVVGLNSDESVSMLKGRGRPILPASERAGILSALACVDCVIIFEETTPERAIARLRPDIHCKGADYEDGKRPLPEAEIVAGYGGRVNFVPLEWSTSTSQIILRIKRLSD